MKTFYRVEVRNKAVDVSRANGPTQQLFPEHTLLQCVYVKMILMSYDEHLKKKHLSGVLLCSLGHLGLARRVPHSVLTVMKAQVSHQLHF